MLEACVIAFNIIEYKTLYLCSVKKKGKKRRKKEKKVAISYRTIETVYDDDIHRKHVSNSSPPVRFDEEASTTEPPAFSLSDIGREIEAATISSASGAKFAARTAATSPFPASSVACN